MSIVKAYGIAAESHNDESTAYLTRNRVSNTQSLSIAIVDDVFRLYYDAAEQRATTENKPVIGMPNWSKELEFYAIPMQRSASVGIRTPKSGALNVSIDMNLGELKKAAAILLACIASIEGANNNQD